MRNTLKINLMAFLCIAMGAAVVYGQQDQKGSKVQQVDAKVPAEEDSALPKKNIKLPAKVPDESIKKSIDADQTHLPEDAPEFVADINDILKTGKMTAISVMQGKLVSSQTGSVQVEIVRGEKKGVTVECTLSENTKGTPYGFKKDTQVLTAKILGDPSVMAKAKVDELIAAHVGHKVKIAVEKDACTYLELIP